MGELFIIVFTRAIIQTTGLFTRYFYFKLTGRKKSVAALSGEHKDDYDDLGKALSQQVLNSIVGFVVFLLVTLLAVQLVYS